MISFFVYTFIPLLVGIISTLLSNMNSYGMFNKPPLSPSAIIFPIVWTILYLLLGYSSYRVKEDDKSLKLFYINLAINGIWSIVFFNGNFLEGFILIIVMIILQVLILFRFKKIDNIAFYLNIPYLLWLIFAAYLSLGVFILN